MENYIKGKGILVGVFDENDIKSNKDREETQKMKEKTGLKYVNSEFVKKNGEIVGLKIYVCTVEDLEDLKIGYNI